MLVDTTDMVRMLDIMQDFCKMEEEIDVVIKSVDAVKQEVCLLLAYLGLGGWPKNIFIVIWLQKLQ